MGTTVSVILISFWYFSIQLNAWSRTLLSTPIAVEVINFMCFGDVEVHCDVHKNPL